MAVTDMRTIDGWMDARAREWMDDVERPRASECHAVPRLARRSMRRACVVYTETLSMPSAPTSRRATTTSRRGVRASERALSTVTANTHDEKEINHSSFIIIIIIVVRRRSIDSHSRAAREGVHGVLRASSRAIARRPSSSIHPRPRASFRAHRRRGLAMRHHHHHRVRSRFSARRRSYAQTVSRRRRTPRARADDGKIFRVASRGPGPRDPDPRRVVARPGRDRSIEPVMARGKSLPDVRRKKYKKRRRRSRAWLACVDDDDGRASRAIRRSRARVSRGARVGVFAVEDMGMFWVIVCGSWCQGWVW